MGFVIFVFTGIAGAIALGLSIVLATIGISIYIRNKKNYPGINKLFFIPNIITILVFYITVSLWPFPQGRPGSNYTEILIEWIAKVVTYLIAPGIGCFLGGIFILLFLNRKNNKLKKK